MPGNVRRIYWDANCFLHLINREPKWLPILKPLLDDANSGTIQIFTSILSKTEVAFAAIEHRTKLLDATAEVEIDKFWWGNKGIVSVEYNDLIALEARRIRRHDMVQGRTGYRVPDIIHMATARRLAVDEMHTTDTDLHKYTNFLGFPVRFPHTAKPMLPGLEVDE